LRVSVRWWRRMSYSTDFIGPPTAVAPAVVPPVWRASRPAAPSRRQPGDCTTTRTPLPRASSRGAGGLVMLTSVSGGFVGLIAQRALAGRVKRPRSSSPF
jgi:hypothetical protein